MRPQIFGVHFVVGEGESRSASIKSNQTNQINIKREAAHTRTAAAKPVLIICRRVVLADSTTIRTSSEALLEARTMPLVVRAATLLCRTDDREEAPKVIGRAHVARDIFSVFCEELSCVFGWTDYSIAISARSYLPDANKVRHLKIRV